MWDDLIVLLKTIKKTFHITKGGKNLIRFANKLIGQRKKNHMKNVCPKVASFFFLCLFDFEIVSPLDLWNNTPYVMIKKSVLFFEEKVILLSYCPFHIFLDDLSVYLKTNFRKAKRDRSSIFGILDN